MSNEQKANRYVVVEKSLQDVLDYLATRPYKEVQGLITGVMGSSFLYNEDLKFTQEQYNKNYDNGFDAGKKEGYSVGYTQAVDDRRPVVVTNREDLDEEEKAI